MKEERGLAQELSTQENGTKILTKLMMESSPSTGWALLDLQCSLSPLGLLEESMGMYYL